ncbi:hypothetical protein S40293_06563 [Stachybotrys chartarum IBT 40293]|nr:hypothetical protein S40293_06563 [Stachybotrys chartarum IBT 40293]
MGSSASPAWIEARLLIPTAFQAKVGRNNGKWPPAHFRRLRLGFLKSRSKIEPVQPADEATTLIPVRADDLLASNERLLVTQTAVLGHGDDAASSSTPPLGLHVLHEPQLAALDIIFVHGLGGHSYNTWTKNHDPTLFWPANWLPYEPDLGIARILTFGYNAKWRGSTKSISTIADFAKELLFEMRFAKGKFGAELELGKRPIIFVVHSMGGLVVKKAYLLGLEDANFQTIVSSVHAIIFLSTPHRGTNLANTLNRIIAATLQPSKSFISDLTKSSDVIEDLNRKFGLVAPKLSIWSFYETLATSIGPRQIVIVEKDSSILGYPGEISKPLHANHSTICKYSSPGDPNYISVKNALRALVTSIRDKSESEALAQELELSAMLAELFGNRIPAQDGYQHILQNLVPGTCDWFIQQPEVKAWMSSPTEPAVLWYTAPPGHGKTVISAFMISHLKNLESSKNGCQYFHFSYADVTKRLTSDCLKGLAFQLARDIPSFARSICQTYKDTFDADSKDSELSWRNSIEHSLPRADLNGPIYWIIDALDECDSPEAFIDCLQDLVSIDVTLKILILSRKISTLAADFERVSPVLPLTTIEKAGEYNNQKDIDLMVAQGLENAPGSSEFRQKLGEIIISRARGNFLWASVVLKELTQCYTEESIEEVLGALPNDMTNLYARMERNLIQSTRKSNSPLIRALLEWCACSQRPLTMQELSEALRPDFPGIIDFKKTVKTACGQFLDVDEDGKVSFVHYTAQQYFTRYLSSHFFIEARPTHEKFFHRTILVLQEPTLRWHLTQNNHGLRSSEPFVFYSAVGWPYHLDKCYTKSSIVLDVLVKFLRGPAVLAWIHSLALIRRLDILTMAAGAFTAIVGQDFGSDHNLDRSTALELLDEWSIDLIKLVGRYSRHLASQPEIIYEIIPALCPGSTVLARTFRATSSSTDFRVKGTEHADWNDNVGRLSLPANSETYKIACGGNLTAVLDCNGVVRLWDASNLIGSRVLSHTEFVTAMAMTDDGKKVATYGLNSTKLWSTDTGKVLFSSENPARVKALALVFSAQNKQLIFGGDDDIVRLLYFNDGDQGWQVLKHDPLSSLPRTKDTIANAPTCIAFSSGEVYFGASYRGAPLSVWRVADGKFVDICQRAKNTKRRSKAIWFAVDKFTWNLHTGHILGLYRDKTLFKWHPLTGENVEAATPADELAVSPNGTCFVTSSSDGTLRVWSFEHFKVLYQVSTEDLIVALAFSPDNRRFYDLRMSVVNVWEPDVITRFNGRRVYEHVPPTGIIKRPREQLVSTKLVTAIAVAPNHKGYCAGYESGIVRFCQESSELGIEVTNFGYELDVTYISWSTNGDYVAMANLGGDVHVKNVQWDEKRATVVSVGTLPQPQCTAPPSAEKAASECHNTRGILFNSSGTSILVWTEVETFVCCVSTGLLEAYMRYEPGDLIGWACHPTRADLVLGSCVDQVQAYDWRTLEMVGSAVLFAFVTRKKQRESQEAATLIFRCSPDHDQVLFTFTGLVEGSCLCETAELEVAMRAPLQTLTSTMKHIHPQIWKHVNTPLGILTENRFVFLDDDMWFCICLINDEGESPWLYERFYFIPSDWTDAESISRCVLDTDGTLYWPRGGQVLRLCCDLIDGQVFPVYA